MNCIVVFCVMHCRFISMYLANPFFPPVSAQLSNSDDKEVAVFHRKCNSLVQF